ncbi:choice-of-anchor J domain-containing protein [uncultured Winogradskyella sp.]|uniref:T9SS-dependent choice-of-anchor J family protein n=1 Tax=uncultured Winogradskyella sp. TaxID=395353 RepID=UPI00261701DD|nr:choice-of-anchor J domain-containing protein [uncultured Winogradskyella sp.]
MKKNTLFLFTLLLLAFTINAQENLDCGNSFTDSGGNDADYATNENITYTICPTSGNSGDVVYVDFSFFSTENNGTACWDGLTIYNGSDTTAPTINPPAGGTVWCWDRDDATPNGSGDLQGMTISSTDASGCLTFVFTSDGSVTREGWEAAVTCAPPPACVDPSDLTVSNISSTTADLSWTENGTATVWDIEIVDVTAMETATGMPTVSGVNNPYTVMGLVDNNDYEFYVRADCGADGTSGWVGPFAFRTACAAFTAPFTEDFENAGNRPNCWTDSGDENWLYDDDGGDHVGNSGVITGSTVSNGFYAYADASGNQANAVLTSPLVDVSGLTTPALSFYLISDAEDSANSQLDVEVWDGAAWNNVGTYNSNTTGWELQTIDISAFTITGPVQVRFGFTEPTTNDFDDDIAIDDVSFNELPACTQPSMLDVVNITSETADLSWSENGTATVWDIEIVDITAMETVTGTPTVTGVSNPYTVMGLSDNNTYEYYVRANCGGDGTSDWVGPFTFSTACNAFDIPFTETFDSTSTTENCWTILNENGDADAWNTNYTLDVISGDENAALTTDFNAGNNDDWLISPAITLTGNERLRFKYSLQSTGEPNDFEVLLSTSGTDVASFTNTILPLATYDDVDIDNGESTELTIDLSTYTGDVNIAWRVPPGGLDGWRLYIDDVVVETIPACVEPSDLMVNSITATSASFSWTENGTATMWDVELVDITNGGSATGTPTVAATMDNPLAITGLVEQNDYELYVRAICGGDTSIWVGPVSFATTCSEVSAEYTADMSVNVPDDCWNEAGSGEVADGPMGLGASDWRENRAYEDADGNVISSNAINLWQSIDREWLLSPSFDLDALGSVGLLVNVAVTNYAFSGTTTAEDTMGSDDEVQLLMTNDNGVTWTNLTTWNVGNQPAVTGTNYVADLSAMSGTVQFAFFGSDGAVDDAEDYDFHVGGFEVSANALSTDEVENRVAFTYYPNPVKNTLTLNAQNTIEHVTMYNMLGQEVLRANPNSVDSNLDMSGLQSGAYFVKVTIASTVQTIRIIKQ